MHVHIRACGFLGYLPECLLPLIRWNAGANKPTHLLCTARRAVGETERLWMSSAAAARLFRTADLFSWALHYQRMQAQWVHTIVRRCRRMPSVYDSRNNSQGTFLLGLRTGSNIVRCAGHLLLNDISHVDSHIGCLGLATPTGCEIDNTADQNKSQ